MIARERKRKKNEMFDWIRTRFEFEIRCYQSNLCNLIYTCGMTDNKSEIQSTIHKKMIDWSTFVSAVRRWSKDVCEVEQRTLAEDPGGGSWRWEAERKREREKERKRERERKRVGRCKRLWKDLFWKWIASNANFSVGGDPLKILWRTRIFRPKIPPARQRRLGCW